MRQNGLKNETECLDTLEVKEKLPRVISKDYIKQNRELHKTTNFGTASLKYSYLVADAVNYYRERKVLDYGSGKGRLAGKLKHLSLDITNYDPAIKEFSKRPDKHPLVACIDVLEHIEPELIDNVIKDLHRVTGRALVATINCKRAGKTLPDGRNAHLIVEKPEWWKEKLRKYFLIKRKGNLTNGFYVILEPLTKIKE